MVSHKEDGRDFMARSPCCVEGKRVSQFLITLVLVAVFKVLD